MLDPHCKAVHHAPVQEIRANQRAREEFRSLVEYPWKTLRLRTGLLWLSLALNLGLILILVLRG